MGDKHGQRSFFGIVGRSRPKELTVDSHGDMVDEMDSNVPASKPASITDPLPQPPYDQMAVPPDWKSKTTTHGKCVHWRVPIKIGKHTILCSSMRGWTAASKESRNDPTILYGIYLDQSWLKCMGSIWSNGDSDVYMGGNPRRAMYVDWPDMGIIGPKTLDKVCKLALNRIHAGHVIEIACIGGHGRTGTLLACLIGKVEHLDGVVAIKTVRHRYCHKAIESQGQEAMIKSYLGGK